MKMYITEIMTFDGITYLNEVTMNLVSTSPEIIVEEKFFVPKTHKYVSNNIRIPFN